MEIKKATSKISTFIELWDLEQADDNIEVVVYKEDIEAFKTIKEVLEKQIEEEPDWEAYTNDAKDDAEAYCPKCDYRFKDETSYCPNCGKKILWS